MSVNEFFQAISNAIESLSEEDVRAVKTALDESKNDCKAYVYNKLNMIAYDELKDER